MNARRPIPSDVQSQLLISSRRRCCLCAYLDHDWRQKLGQVAHVNQEASDASPDNLVWLCLDHHSIFDSTTRQHKNITQSEVKLYRARLYEEIEDKLSQGLETAAYGAALPYVVVFGFVVREPGIELALKIKNFADVGGLITQIIFDHQTHSYRWEGATPIAARDTDNDFRVRAWKQLPVPLEKGFPEFTVEVSDFGEMVTRVRTGCLAHSRRRIRDVFGPAIDADPV